VTIGMGETMNVRAITRTTNGTTTTIGRDAARATGGQITERGNREEDIADTVFLNIGLADILAPGISFGFTICPFGFPADIQASCMAGIGSVSLTYGQNTGRKTGMKRTMCTLPTPATAITCLTAGFPAWQLPSAFQCSERSPFAVFAGGVFRPSQSISQRGEHALYSEETPDR
jgi:hypothetical protein